MAEVQYSLAMTGMGTRSLRQQGVALAQSASQLERAILNSCQASKRKPLGISL